MAQTVRVALSGYNALTETDISKYSLYADSDNVLIKEFARGAGSISFGNTATISHNLSYIPLFLVYTEVASGRYRIANSFDPLGAGWRAYTDTNDLFIENAYSSSFTDYKYFIFYDDMD